MEDGGARPCERTLENSELDRRRKAKNRRKSTTKSEVPDVPFLLFLP